MIPGETVAVTGLSGNPWLVRTDGVRFAPEVTGLQAPARERCLVVQAHRPRLLLVFSLASDIIVNRFGALRLRTYSLQSQRINRTTRFAQWVSSSQKAGKSGAPSVPFNIG